MRGHTLAELLVALGLSIMLLAGLASAWRVLPARFLARGEGAELRARRLAGLHALRRDLHNADAMGLGPRVMDTAGSALRLPCRVPDWNGEPRLALVLWAWDPAGRALRRRVVLGSGLDETRQGPDVPGVRGWALTPGKGALTVRLDWSGARESGACWTWMVGGGGL